MQVVLNKQEKEELVIKLYRQGKTIRQIAHTLDWYHRNIKINKQILADLDKQINQSEQHKD